MTTSERFEEIRVILNAEDSKTAEETLTNIMEEIFSSVSVLSREKELRKESSDILKQLPIKTVAAKLSSIALEKSVLQATDIGLLLQWTNAVLENAKDYPECSVNLLQAQGAFLRKAISSLYFSKKSAKAASRMNFTLIHSSWRAMERFCIDMRIPADGGSFDFEKTLSEIIKQPYSIVTLALLAIVYNEAQSPNLSSVLPSKVGDIMETWTQQILNSKANEFSEIVTPLVSSKLLNAFWEKDIVSQEVFDEKIVPAIHKSLLRSPENVISYVLPSILSNHSLIMDKLVTSPSLVSNLGSSNALLRKATAKTFYDILTHTQKPDLSGVINQFKRITNSEQRALFASVLAGTPLTGDVDASLTALESQAPKESSDISLRTIADAIVKFVPTNNGHALEAIKKGLQEKRKPLLREWVNALAISEMGDPFTTDLQKVYSSITSNIGTAITEKCASAVYGLLILLKPDNVNYDVFSPRIFEHLTCDREFDLCAKACALLYSHANGADQESVLDAFVNSVISKGASPKQRLANLHLLKHTLGKDSVSDETYASLIKVLEKYVNEKNVDVSSVVSHIPTKKWLIQSFILSHHPLAQPSDGGWISMCLKAQFDPNKLVNENADDLFAKSTAARSVDSVATLAFVAPESIAQKIDAFINSEMKSETMSSLDEAILQTPEGQLAVVAPPQMRSRNSAKTEKTDKEWEEELRKEIAKKHGKLTAEDQKKLAEQTERRKVLQVEADRIEFCCSILSKLSFDSVKGAENGSLVWFPNGIELCLKCVKNNYPSKQAAIECLSSMSVCLSDRFKGHWKMIASKLLLQGKKVDITAVRSMLYMLNPNSDKRLLDTSSLVYILPTLRTVMVNYNGDVEDETADETILLVTSLLANQAEVLAKIPRDDLIEIILNLLVKFATDRGSVKDCLRRIAQQVVFNSNELHTLLDASVSASQDFVRAAALEIIDAEVDLSSYEFSPEIWISRFGEFSDVAQDIWTENGMSIPQNENVLELLLPFFQTKYSVERQAVAKSYTAAALVVKKIPEAFTLLANLYVEKKNPPKPIINSYGMEVKQKWIDPIPERLSIVAALHVLTRHLPHESVIKCAEFIANEGVTDKCPELVRANLELGKTLIDEHGKECVDGILPVFEGKQIVLYGFAAQHLPENDPRLLSTVDKLLEALQSADDDNITVISLSLGSLAKRVDYQDIAERTLDETFTLPTTEARRGAAYGFSGIASGIGLSVLGDVSIINAISGAVEDKKDAGRREGAQLLVVALSKMFGKLFEPYAIELMTQVLSGLGDVNVIVRKAANEAARSIMANTTSFGIKKQIPQALDLLDTTAWRSKKGAVELLGSMAYLSPQQLAMSLATVVPEIVALLNDTHKEVRASAKSSMEMFGNVIENPEINKLVPTLLDAISDPTKKTDHALTQLLKTRFMHYIDSPSLALIIFVIQRGLRDRSANVKRKACQIVGNMSILTTGRDLVPYLPTILPDLQVAMTDPVPQTCAVACKALGVLVEKLGEDYFPNVISDLMDTLKSNDPQAVGNRWGTAQGLAEVLHGLGTTKLDELLPEIVANCQSPLNHVRQGFIPMILLLPASFGASLTPYLPQLIPPLLRGLADDLDDVRENSLKAGRRIVRGYANIAVDLLLPELERGLWSPKWRIRLASVELVGDLIMELLGKTAVKSAVDRIKSIENAAATSNGEVADNAENEEQALAAEQEAQANEEVNKQTGAYVEANLRNLEVLGVERRDRVLSAIFICRADVVAAVRQTALDTWLAIIQNTPRAVKLILPTLVVMLVKRLGDEDEELQTNAARALAELVRRVSDALRLILPTLLENLKDSDARQGICLGLVELIPATQVQVLQEHEKEIMHLIRTCLQDTNNTVREAATRALDEVHTALGDVSGDMLPEMVSQVVNENDDGALAGIKEMVVSSGASVLAAALPALLKSNLDEFKANAITSICVTAGAQNLHRYVEDVVDCLIRSPYADNLDPILVQICPESHLLSLAKKDEFLRAPVFKRMAAYYNNAEKVDHLFVSDWVTFALHGLEDENTSESSVELLQALSSSKAMSKSDLAKLASPAYHTLQTLSIPIPMFAAAAKGPAFVLPFFLNGLTLGGNAEKEESAMAIAEVLRRTRPAEKLKPVVTQIAGPLIRIVGERTVSDVKAAIIYTLDELLKTIPAFVKPFLPQLQRTFAKNLADEGSQIVRTRSALALGTLIKLQPRIDPLAKEIVTGVRTNADAGVRTAFLTALEEIVAHAGNNLSEAVRESIAELINESAIVLGEASGTNIKEMALFAKIGAEMTSLGDANNTQNAKRVVERLLNANSAVTLQSVLNANAILLHTPQALSFASGELVALLEKASRSSNAILSENGVSGLGKLLLNKSNDSSPGQLKPYEERAVNVLSELIIAHPDRSVDVRRLSTAILTELISHHQTCAVMKPFLDKLVPEIFVNARDRNIPIKIASERAFMSLFDFKARKDSVLFDEWFASAKDKLDARLQRSIPEYVRRVALRAANREDDANEEDENTASDLKEIWTVGLE